MYRPSIAYKALHRASTGVSTNEPEHEHKPKGRLLENQTATSFLKLHSICGQTEKCMSANTFKHDNKSYQLGTGSKHFTSTCKLTNKLSSSHRIDVGSTQLLIAELAQEDSEEMYICRCQRSFEFLVIPAQWKRSQPSRAVAHLPVQTGRTVHCLPNNF